MECIRSKYFLIVGLLFFVGCVYAEQQEVATADKRLQWLIESRIKSPVIHLDSKSFKRYLDRSPRPYSVILLFTGSEKNCPICKYMARTIYQIATYFGEQYGETDKQNSLFFIYVDSDTGLEAFKKYDVQHLPIIIHIPATPGAYNPNEDRFNIQSVEDIFDPNYLARWVQYRTGIQIEIPLWFYETVLFRRILIAVLALLVIRKLPFLIKNIRHPLLWFVVCMGIYFFAFSGIVFNVMNDAPFWINMRALGIRFVAHGLRNQFGIEGYFLAAYCLFLGSMWIVLTKLPYLKNKTRRNVLFFVTAFLLAYAINWLAKFFAVYKMTDYPWFCSYF